MSSETPVTPAYVDAPHPWTYHDSSGTDVAARITDANGNEVTVDRAWLEVQMLRSEVHSLLGRIASIANPYEAWCAALSAEIKGDNRG